MWYFTTYWNPNPHMTDQLKGVVRNYIWGGNFNRKCVKLCWDTLTLPLASGGLGIIDSKA